MFLCSSQNDQKPSKDSSSQLGGLLAPGHDPGPVLALIVVTCNLTCFPISHVTLEESR